MLFWSAEVEHRVPVPHGCRAPSSGQKQVSTQIFLSNINAALVYILQGIACHISGLLNALLLHCTTGVRATHGITTGRYWFSVQIMEPLETTLTNIGDSADMYSDEDATANTIHCCRCDSMPLTAYARHSRFQASAVACWLLSVYQQLM